MAPYAGSQARIMNDPLERWGEEAVPAEIRAKFKASLPPGFERSRVILLPEGETDERHYIHVWYEDGDLYAEQYFALRAVTDIEDRLPGCLETIRASFAEHPSPHPRTWLSA